MLAVSALLMLMGPAAVVPANSEATCADVRIEVQAPKGLPPRRQPPREPRREAQWELRREGAAFSARQVQDLQLVVTSRRPRRRGALELWLYTPKGYLYQVLTATATARHGMRHPPENRVTLPVNGTLITVNGLYGRWRVEPHLNRAAKPCGAATEFRLRP